MTWPPWDGEVELLRSIVDVPSVSGAEGPLVAMLAERARAAGFHTHVDAVGNLHCAVGDPAGPEILLLGHVDTVPGHIPVRLAGGVLTGRGTVDAKGPFAGMLCAATRLKDRTTARIVVVGAVGEEAASEGNRHLLHRRPPAAVVIGEPSGVHSVGLGYKGVVRFRVDFRQPAAHTSSAEPTAGEVGYALWADLTARLAAGQAHDAPLFGRALPSIVALHADLERAALEISCRIPLGFDTAGLLAWLDGRAARITVLEEVPAVRSPRTDPVARSISAAIRGRGGRPVPKLKLGTSDWNVVGPVWKVPIAAYGPGNSRLCHTADEHIEISEYLAAIDVLTDALALLAESLAEAPQPVPAAAGAVRSMQEGMP